MSPMSPMSCVMSLSMSEHCHHCQGTGPAGEITGNSPKISQHTINAMIVLVVNVCSMALSLLMDDEQRGWDPQHAIFECLYHET